MASRPFPGGPGPADPEPGPGNLRAGPAPQRLEHVVAQETLGRMLHPHVDDHACSLSPAALAGPPAIYKARLELEGDVVVRAAARADPGTLEVRGVRGDVRLGLEAVA